MLESSGFFSCQHWYSIIMDVCYSLPSCVACLFATDETKDSSNEWSTSEDEEDEGNGFNPLCPSPDHNDPPD